MLPCDHAKLGRLHLNQETEKSREQQQPQQDVARLGASLKVALEVAWVL